jgi:hypothetical protein
MPEIFEKTVDPHVDIVSRSEGVVEYLSDTGERWLIHGQCNLCGACYKGSTDPLVVIDERRIGQAGAAQRLDGRTWYEIPVRPEIADLPECNLTGKYL